MDPSLFHGVIPPLVTPMHPDGSLNLDVVPALVDYALARGVHGIFAPGSQGEAFALTPDERLAVIEAVLAAVNGRVPVIAGTGALSTRQAVVLSRQAEAAGVDALSILTPYFITPTQDELYGYYADIAAAVSVPIMGYSNPTRTGNVRLTPATVGRLATDIPHFIGIKDSSGSLAETAAIMRACPEGFRVFVGHDSLLYSALCIGAVGAVALTANVIPDLLVEVYNAFQAGDHGLARQFQTRVAILRDALPQLGSYPAPMKAALEMVGIPVGPPRLPIKLPSPAERAALRELLQSIGVALTAEE